MFDNICEMNKGISAKLIDPSIDPLKLQSINNIKILNSAHLGMRDALPIIIFNAGFQITVILLEFYIV